MTIIEYLQPKKEQCAILGYGTVSNVYKLTANRILAKSRREQTDFALVFPMCLYGEFHIVEAVRHAGYQVVIFPWQNGQVLYARPGHSNNNCEIVYCSVCPENIYDYIQYVSSVVSLDAGIYVVIEKSSMGYNCDNIMDEMPVTTLSDKSENFKTFTPSSTSDLLKAPMNLLHELSSAVGYACRI